MMDNHLSLGNAPSGTLLSVIIRTDPQKYSFHDSIRDSLRSFRKIKDERIQIIVVLPHEDEDAAAFCRQQAKKLEVDIVAEEKLEEAVQGEFLTVIENGDKINNGCFDKFMKELERRETGVYLIRIPEEGDVVVEEASRVSIFTEASMPIYPRGVIIAKTVLQDPVKELLPADMTACGATWKAALQSRGYTELHYEAIRLLHKHPVFFDYSIKTEVLRELAAFSEEKYGCVEDIVQSVMMDLCYSELQQHGSKAAVKALLPYIEDDIIMARLDILLVEKLNLLDLKYDRPVLPDSKMHDDGQVTFGETKIALLRQIQFRIDIIEISEGMITFRGRTELHLFGDKYQLYIISSKGVRQDIELIPYAPFDRTGLDEECFFHGRRFEITVPVKIGQSYMFFLEDELGRQFQLAPKYGNFSGLVERVPFSYFCRNDIILIARNGTLTLRKYTAKQHRKLEIDFMKVLLSKGKLAIIAYRILYHLDRLITRKPIWIIADRPHVAKDNGEHMFRYLQTTDAVRKKTVYFLIKKDSSDFERLRRIGKILPYGSLKHKIKFMQAEAIISAAANNLATNALGKSGHYYRDLYGFDFVYLRHGVSHNDQSVWINRLNKNIKVLVATCRPEYEGILNGDYDYTEQEVKLTGLPRFDNLYDEKQKKIAILPTWRKDIQGEVQNRSSERDYIKGFKDTDYFEFYDSLIHNERLLQAMEKLGYEGCFYLHPAFEAQLSDFSSSRRISVGTGIADYQEIFRESAIMVTDYSSVAFDFAYLKKPVIYSQFDEDTFYEHHSWGKGYFTYREDGFGPITNTVEQTVDKLIHYMENDGQMEEEYVKKVDDFFAYTDRNNCERVYNAVLEDLERKYR